MDYETKPTSRKDLRRLSTYVRRLFDVPEPGPFPVLDALEKLPDIYAFGISRQSHIVFWTEHQARTIH